MAPLVLFRLAHNVLSLDGDAFILRDPYPFLKQGPLADTHLLALRGARQGTPSTAILYVQVWPCGVGCESPTGVMHSTADMAARATAPTAPSFVFYNTLCD